MPDAPQPYRIAVYAALFLLSLFTVLRVVPCGATLVITTAVLLVFDRAALKGVDYSLLLTFVFLFIFVGNLGNIAPLSDFLTKTVNGHEVIVGVSASQVLSNVPAAVLLAGFTDNAKALLVGVNLGGMGTLIASMASLISFKYIIREKVKTGKYIFFFTVVNVAFLAANLVLWKLIS